MPNTNKTNDMSSGALLCYNKTEDDDVQQTKHVTLRVNSASNLINTDSGIMGDLTDPYVEVFSMLTPYNKFQTSVIMNDLNPVWDEEITLEIMHPEDTVLVFNIWDHNRVAKDKRVGSCALSLTEVKLQRGNAVNVCLNIHDAFSLQGTLQIELVPEDFDFICQQPAIKLDMSTKAGDMQSIIQLKTTKQYTKYLQQQLAHKSYLDVMDEVDTGDLLLSSGVNSVHLAAIQLYTRSMLCYIGMIVKKPSDSLKQAFGLQGNLAVLEVMISSGSEHSQGIRLVDYQAYYKDIAKQGSVCTLRKLTIDDKELTTQIRSSDHLNFAADLAETVPVCSQREYLQHLIETERSDKDVILPGEFIAICMKRLGLLPNSVDTSRFVPQDFAATSNTLVRNGLLKGCSYSPECLLTNTRSLKRLEAFFKSDENKFLF